MIARKPLTAEDRNETLLRCLSRSRFLFDAIIENFVGDIISIADTYIAESSAYEGGPHRVGGLTLAAAFTDLSTYLYPLFSPYLSFVKRPAHYRHPVNELGSQIHMQIPTEDQSS